MPPGTLRKIHPILPSTSNQKDLLRHIIIQKHIELLFHKLKNRNYPTKRVQHQIENARQQERHALIEQKYTIASTQEIIPLTVKCDPRIKILQEWVHESHKPFKISKETVHFHAIKPVIAF